MSTYFYTLGVPLKQAKNGLQLRCLYERLERETSKRVERERKRQERYWRETKETRERWSYGLTYTNKIAREIEIEKIETRVRLKRDRWRWLMA